MKFFWGICLLMYSFNASTEEIVIKGKTFPFSTLSASDMKAFRAVSQIQCASKLKDYNFEKEFEALFQYSYLKRDVSKIKQMSLAIEKDLKDYCKKNHYLIDGFRTQHCYETCWENYPKTDKDELIREQCQATCSSVDRKISSPQRDLATLIDKNIVDTDTDNCKASNAISVDNTSRSEVKQKYQGNVALPPSTGAIPK